MDFLFLLQQEFCSFCKQLSSYSFLFLIWCSSGFCSWFFFLLFIFLNSQRIISSFSLQSQLYADDSYIFTSFPKYELFSTISKISSCIGKIISWSDSMFLELNPSKLDLIYFSKSSRLIESLPSVNISS